MKEKMYVLQLDSFMVLLLEKLKVLNNTGGTVLFLLVCYEVIVCRTLSSTDLIIAQSDR